MKNVLVIAYYFPPSGGPGVQRVLKHVRYLKEFGWNPIVLTVSNGQFPAKDESLLEQIPKDVVVKRTHIFEPYDLYRLLTGKPKGSAIDVNVIKKDGAKIGFKEQLAEFIRATLFIPDARIGWLFTAKKEIDRIVKEYQIDAVYSSSPPYTCSLIAQYAQKKFEIPWVAGFRDPWTGFISSPKRWFLPAWLDKRMEYKVFLKAKFIECAWEGIIKDALSKFPDLNKDKFIHSPNGFDSNDYPKIDRVENSKFTITYTGSMYGRRNPLAFFNAIEMLICENKISQSDFHIRLIGRFGDEIHTMIDNTSFKSSIEVISYLPHKDSIAKLMQSDLLLLIVDESKESAEIVPGKVYEYIGTRKPVMTIAPEKGAIADLINDTDTGLIAHQENLEGIKTNFIKFFEDWKNKTNRFIGNEEIAKYERKNSAKKLAELLDLIAKK